MAERTKPRGCLGIIGRILGTIILIGIVLAVWRYVGQGEAINSPHWFENASQTVTRLGNWFSQLIDNLVNRGGQPDPAATPTKAR